MAILQNRLSTEPDVAPYVPPADRDHTLNEDWEGGPLALEDTSEGMNYQAWKLTYDPSTPPGYNPDMMRYDGVTGYYNLDITTAGNKETAVARINLASVPAGTAAQYIYRSAGLTQLRSALLLVDGNHSNPDFRNTINFIVWNSVGTIITRLITSVGVDMTGAEHMVFASYDGDAGTALMYVDDVPDDVTNPSRIAPAVATLDTGFSGQFVGSANGTLLANGDIGYFGYSNTYLTNWSDFMDGNQPKQLDEITWTEWGAQPLLWNEDGEMTASLGTAGNMTKNGTIIKVNVGNYQYFTLTPETTGSPIIPLTGVNSIQCSFCFDQNARPTIAWVDGSDQGHLYWYSTLDAEYQVFDFANPVWGLALTLDDKRSRQIAANDILLWYTLPAAGPDHYALFHRRQRDRFETIYPMADPVWPYIHKLGMNERLRVQIDLSTAPPT